MSRFTNSLIVSPMADGKTWVILGRFDYDVGALDSGDTVRISRGFMTDFASIPRMFWAVLPKWGKYGNAAVVHDWLYWQQERPRLEADRIMLEAMGVLAVPAWKKYAIYYAVRTFGAIAWKRNQWDRLAGFERVVDHVEFKSVAEAERPGVVRRALGQYADLDDAATD